MNIVERASRPARVRTGLSALALALTVFGALLTAPLEVEARPLVTADFVYIPVLQLARENLAHPKSSQPAARHAQRHARQVKSRGKARRHARRTRHHVRHHARRPHAVGAASGMIAGAVQLQQNIAAFLPVPDNDAAPWAPEAVNGEQDTSSEFITAEDDDDASSPGADDTAIAENEQASDAGQDTGAAGAGDEEDEGAAADEPPQVPTPAEIIELATAFVADEQGDMNIGEDEMPPVLPAMEPLADVLAFGEAVSVSDRSQVPESGSLLLAGVATLSALSLARRRRRVTMGG